MSAFTSAWSLKSLGAPELMQQCFAENQHLNSFHVLSTEGRTRLCLHHHGERQGDVKACDSTSIFNMVRVKCLINLGIMYRYSIVDPVTGRKEDRVGFYYVDDCEHHLCGEEAARVAVSILGKLRILCQVRIHTCTLARLHNCMNACIRACVCACRHECVRVCMLSHT